MKRALILFLAFVSSLCTLFGQKIKYKELYPLLESSQYGLAIPLLRKYLVDPKGQVNANAHLQMGIYLEKLAKEEDIIKNTGKVGLYSDSAVIFYQRAKDLLTEKQLKKNEDYYRSYERRDVRTGKVGVKVADIHYQLEKNVERLNDRKTVVAMVKDHYSKGMEVYTQGQVIFKRLKESYPTEKALYLRSDRQVLRVLDSLDVSYKEALKEFGDFKSVLGNVERAGYDPKLNLLPIENYPQDGLKGIDPTLEALDIWDYAEWIESVKLEMLETAWPLRQELVDYDAMLDALTKQVRADSVAYNNEINGYGELKTKLMTYDPDPLPIKVFEVKKTGLKYLSKAFAYSSYSDSSDYIYKAKALRDKLSSLSILDSALDLLTDSPWETEWVYYTDYINSSFGEFPGFEEFINTRKTFVKNEGSSIMGELKHVEERIKWLIDETDSIPLFDPDSLGLAHKFVPLILEEGYTAGLYFPIPGDTAKGYFSLVNKARVPESKVFFDIPSNYFNKGSAVDVLNKVDIDETGQVYHLMFYLPMAERENYAASICKIYTSDGLAWGKDLILDAAPADLKISNESGEVKIKYDLNSYTGDKELPNQIVLDKKGLLKE